MSDRNNTTNLFLGCDEHTINDRLTWINEPESWHFRNGALEIVPKPKTDFFRPLGGEAHDSACLLFTDVEGDFTAVAVVSAVLAGFGDAVALTVRSDPERWMKICVERSPSGEIAVVSVVTNGSSDDANGELLLSSAAEIRITRREDVFGMHYREKGEKWRFVRAFGYALPKALSVGVHAQAPFYAGCSAIIHSFTISDIPIADHRSGE